MFDLIEVLVIRLFPKNYSCKFTKSLNGLGLIVLFFFSLNTCFPNGMPLGCCFKIKSLLGSSGLCKDQLNLALLFPGCPWSFKNISPWSVFPNINISCNSMDSLKLAISYFLILLELRIEGSFGNSNLDSCGELFEICVMSSRFVCLSNITVDLSPPHFGDSDLIFKLWFSLFWAFLCFFLEN